MSGFHDFTDTARTHDIAKTDRGDIGFTFIHPASHGRVKRKVMNLQQHLTVCKLILRLISKGEIAALGLANRTSGKANGVVDSRVVGRHWSFSVGKALDR